VGLASTAVHWRPSIFSHRRRQSVIVRLGLQSSASLAVFFGCQRTESGAVVNDSFPNR
jgi:hypothetical protein